MKSIEDTVQEIDELIVRELEFLKDARAAGGINTPGSSQSIGAIDVLRELKGWIMEP